MIPEVQSSLTNSNYARLIALAVILLGFLAYINTFDGEFVWDDVSSVLLHQHVRDPGKIGNLFTSEI